MSSENSDNFTSSFPIWIHFISFSSLITMPMTSENMLNKGDERRHSCLVPDLSGNVFCFTTESDVSCGFIIYGLYYAELGSLYDHILERFYLPNRKTRNKPKHLWLTIYDKGDKTYSRGQIISSISGAEKTGQLHAKE